MLPFSADKTETCRLSNCFSKKKTVERSRVYGRGFVCRVSALRIKCTFSENLKEEEKNPLEHQFLVCFFFCFWFCFFCLFVVVVLFAQRPDLCWEGLTRTKTAIHNKSTSTCSRKIWLSMRKMLATVSAELAFRCTYIRFCLFVCFCFCFHPCFLVEENSE